MPSPACCTAMCGEFRSPMFDLAEPQPSGLTCSCCAKRGKGDDAAPPPADDASGNADAPPPRRLDVVRTFSPPPRVPYILAKLIVLGWGTSVLYISIDTHRHPDFWLAYLTHWGLVGTVAYMLLSVVAAIYLAFRPPENPGVLEGGLGVFLKTTWALFTIAAPSQVMVTVLYWALEFNGRSDYWYKTIMTHGGVMLLTMIDGWILSRIPIRVKQLVLYALFGTSYLLWTVIHAYSGIGNPYAEEDNRDDDAIYQSIAWKKNPAGAAIMTVLVIFVFIPVIGLFCRALSRALPRRLCEDEKTFQGKPEKEQEIIQNDEEAAAAAVVY